MRTVLEREWKDDKHHGKGKMTFANNFFYEGEQVGTKAHTITTRRRVARQGHRAGAR